MNLHEYQAKDLFQAFQIPVPTYRVANNGDEAVAAAQALGGERWVIKAQVHAGGRGKAGGVKIAKTLDEVRDYTNGMIGQRLVTKQTDAKGLPINQIVVETPSNIASELYLSIVLDRSTERLAFMASASGGMDIEEVAEHSPEKIRTFTVHPVTGVQPFHARELGFFLGLTKAQIPQLEKILRGIYELAMQKDASQVEVNPLIITAEGNLMALDAKINLDDNSLFRHKDLEAQRDPSQEDENEQIAAEFDLNYVQLDGDIGCMVNGAGLAMATMDLVQLHGGAPANFLDVGGGATKERVTAAFKIITSQGNVKAILVNIFGGIVRCDLIAEGIIAAVKETGLSIPVVARLQGTNVEIGRDLLAKSGYNITPANDLTDAAQKVVAAARA